MNEELKVGDRVRITQDVDTGLIGLEGTLVEIDPLDLNYPYRVEIDSLGYSEWVEQVERVEQ